jgi:hypothetical protein
MEKHETFMLLESHTKRPVVFALRADILNEEWIRNRFWKQF